MPSMTPAARTPRRTQHERSETTVSALLDAARGLFAQDGYSATSLDAVVASAGVTKGAVYHHFATKRDLFGAVFEREQRALVDGISVAYAGRRDPWQAFEAGCRAFFELCQDPETQRIVLLDAPTALGWQTVREMESGVMALMQLGLTRAMDGGRLRRRPVEPLAHLLFGAMCEGAMLVARADDPAAAHRSVLAELRRLLHAIAES